MIRFRSSSPYPSTPVSGDDIRAIIADAIRPGNFFAAAELRLDWRHGNEDVYWELFRGHALDHTKTRRRQSFEAWSVCDGNTDEPLLSVKFDAPGGQVHVTRSILCRVWEGYTEGEQVLSRETTRRVRELLGTIDLSRGWSAADLHDELIALLFFAVVGTSRLPLTSLEAPVPEFTSGQLACCYRQNSGERPIRSIQEWLGATDDIDLAAREHSRRLEFTIRAGGAISASPDLFRAMFNDIALSPYGDFVSRTLAVLNGSMTVVERVDLLTHLLRQNARHLTSFDLIRFHHRGANYPDALLLEEVATEVWRLAAERPDLFLPRADDSSDLLNVKRLRRRAVRQAWLIRRDYHGHLVPDAPTSPGENARASAAPIPEEQILDPTQRTRRLFEGSSALDEVTPVLRQSIADLTNPIELRELGVGLFLDRPFGFAKARGEPDATLMLSHEAFSARIAQQRLEILREIEPNLPAADFTQFRGIAWYSPIQRQRPGVVSVQDAQRDDWVFQRTTRSAVRALLEHYELRLQCEPRLILPSLERADELWVYDAELVVRERLLIDASAGYVSRAGTEYVALPISARPSK